ncbi:MAG: pyridoxal-phosphate dependent enzyme, partial [Thiolinea sp.]
KLMGATIHYYPEGEDEEGADRALEERAAELRALGKKPHVIPLSGNHTPYGALGYVDCAEEMLQQFAEQDLAIDAIVLASGSAGTHSGLLAGLKARGSEIATHGICVRRDQAAQANRVYKKACEVAEMIEHAGAVSMPDVKTDDRSLAPGYGQLNADTREAIQLCAEHEGLLLDPTYTGKAIAGLIRLMRDGAFTAGQNIVFLHTGGTPALFAYPELV